jgi:hypothetical protein
LFHDADVSIHDGWFYFVSTDLTAGGVLGHKKSGGIFTLTQLNYRCREAFEKEREE